MTCLGNLQRCSNTFTGAVFEPLKFVYDPNIKNIDRMISKDSVDAIRGSRLATVNMFYDAFNSPDGTPYEGKKLTNLGKEILKNVL